MKNSNIKPRGEALREALRWLSDQGRHDPAAIEEAALRFDLNPVDEEFLMAEARRVTQAVSRPQGTRDDE